MMMMLEVVFENTACEDPIVLTFHPVAMEGEHPAP
jgi:hypothetical protein